MNGTSSTSEGLTPAQKLMAQHAEENHRPQIEDVEDEEDIAHPVPSTRPNDKPSNNTQQPILSEVAQGKQRAPDASASTKSGRAFDTKDEEAFPALGPPKSAGAPTAQAWGKKPAIVSMNGNKAAPNGASAGGRQGPAPMSIPGRHVEKIIFRPNQMIPRQQLKKPIPAILDDVFRKYRVKVNRTDGPEGASIFSAEGPVEPVRNALKEVATLIGSKQSLPIHIPASVRPYIIGKGGATIQGIQKRSGAKIQMPKQDEAPASVGADDDEDPTVIITVEGDALAAEMARVEIEKIVNERTKDVSLKIRDIPAEFYPFLRGPNDAGINALENGSDIKILIPKYHNWRDEGLPAPAPRGQPAPFVPQQSLPISIAGDRAAAQQARDRMMRQAQALQRQLTHDQIQLERGRHQFVTGDRGDALQEILQETGCAVILPPPGHDSETLYVVGPADRIEQGINKVMDLASSMSVTNVDVARQHANSQEHARNLTRYLQQRQALADLERKHNARIVLPVPGSAAPWEVYSREGKNGMKARQDIMELVRAHPPHRVSPMEIDPFFHQRMQQREAERIRREHGVHLVFPEGSDGSEVLLVYEQPGSPSGYEFPRAAPTAQQIKEHELAIRTARQYLQQLISQHEKITQQQMEAPPKFHDKIRRHVERQQQGLPEDRIPVQLLFPQAAARQASARPSNITLRGPTNHVNELQAQLLAFLQEAEQDELERSYTTSFEFPQKHANFLIGKRGENIKKLRDEFDVEIQVKDGQVEIQGPKKKADACKSHILSDLKKWQDEATHTLHVEPDFHKELIGSQGAQVRKLEERYNVRINFPRSGDVDDGATEGSVKNYRQQAPNHVVVRGPSKGADAARQELMDLLDYYKKNSQSATVSVARSQVPSIIGKGGAALDDLRMRTQCQINIPGKDEVDANGRIQISIKGEKANVAEAKKLLEAAAKQFDDTVTRTVDVPKKYHQTIIGSKGAHLAKLQTEAGGAPDARIIQMPHRDSDDTTIRVVGPQSVCDNIIMSLQKFVEEHEGRVTETLEVPPQKHRLLIGHAGATRRKLETDLHVSLDIPKQGVEGAARSQIKITGQPAAVEAAKEHITGMLKEQEGETIQVPRAYHHYVSDNGSLFRRLKDDHKVNVDHAGQTLPPRPAASKGGRGRANGAGAMPLITDDPEAVADAHSWDLQQRGGPLSSEESSETIPWIIRGPSAENIARARQIIEKQLAAAQKPSATGYLILPDPRSYRFVIGSGGSTINGIRSQTGTKITVPKSGGGAGEAIVIEGPVEGVEEARDLILEAVAGGQRRD